MRFISLTGLFALVLYLVFLAIPFWRILKGIGFNPWFSLLMGPIMAVPLLNAVMLYCLAFAKWPAANSPAADSK